MSGIRYTLESYENDISEKIYWFNIILVYDKKINSGIADL